MHSPLSALLVGLAVVAGCRPHSPLAEVAHAALRDVGGGARGHCFELRHPRRAATRSGLDRLLGRYERSCHRSRMAPVALPAPSESPGAVPLQQAVDQAVVWYEPSGAPYAVRRTRFVRDRPQWDSVVQALVVAYDGDGVAARRLLCRAPNRPQASGDTLALDPKARAQRRQWVAAESRFDAWLYPEGYVVSLLAGASASESGPWGVLPGGYQVTLEARDTTRGWPSACARP
jgi:hypothetical protein